MGLQERITRSGAYHNEEQAPTFPTPTAYGIQTDAPAPPPFFIPRSSPTYRPYYHPPSTCLHYATFSQRGYSYEGQEGVRAAKTF